MDPRVSIITLGVKDLKRSNRFYQEIMGWARTSASNDQISFFYINKSMLLSLYNCEALVKDTGIMDPMSLSSLGRFTMAYTCKSEQEVDGLFEYFKKYEVKVVKEPHKVFWGGYSGYISDPDGHYWEIAYNPYLVMDPNGHVESDEKDKK
eukprot:CAMPEP_0118717330 /NCGR_PEP_ID=MMETSP0800-20121206/28080_1 /TAXON_ID=210618 ORGANISM="Striatella unipunctata, Strain CCMP2910" /NCGR_SAMPLE_ID=MMETSP0800 /ASSEMBLY_ACC=CAM_ASM_000638 /LENGTH=149 /DNA_ID=CAMNT_0006624017 /DNA_START=70 /DNA_END=519 /DNA_ORIENTATION=-